MRKKYITLNEDELSSIIKESIQEIINDNDFDIDSIDISAIDYETLKDAYVDLRLTPTLTTYGDPLSDLAPIKEIKGEIMSPDNVVNAIRQKYNLKEQFVIKREANNKICIYIILACLGINDKLIETDMKRLGYYISNRKPPKNFGGLYYQILQFEPYSQIQTDETTNIRELYDFLLHWTPKYNVEQILLNGLTPTHRNKKFEYPHRIYLIKGDSDYHQLKELGQELCKYNFDTKNDGKYTLLKIDLKNIGEEVRFYHDPNSEIGVYTELPIPPQHIKTAGNFYFEPPK